MDMKLVLLESISLLFRESQLENRNTDSKELVKEAIATIKLPETTIEGDPYRETLVAFNTTIEYLLKSTEVLNREHLLQRLRVNVASDVNLFKAFEESFKLDLEEAELKKAILRYRNDLQTYLREFKIKEVLRKHYTRTHYGVEKISWETIIDEISSELEPLRCGLSDLRKSWLVDEVDLDDQDSLQVVVEKALSENGVEGMLKCGWQGVNNMLGDETYYRRGDSVVHGGLQHNFKSGWAMNHFKHFAIYNKPYMINPEKKPLLLFISAENSIKDNLVWLYINLKENETGEACDIRAVSAQEISTYVISRLTEQGYKIKMKRIDPSDFTYRDLFDIILELEADGFEIHACIFDYLNMISKRGCTQGPTGSDIRDLFRRVRNFMSPKGILFMTPHQLSTEAKGLLRSGVSAEDLVKEIANKGYWDSCRTIDQEVDLEIYHHKVVKDGISYLCVQRGKHRKPTITPEDRLYFVLRFHPVGGIRDDIGKANSTLRKVGGKAVSEGADTEWWD